MANMMIIMGSRSNDTALMYPGFEIAIMLFTLSYTNTSASVAIIDEKARTPSESKRPE